MTVYEHLCCFPERPISYHTELVLMSLLRAWVPCVVIGTTLTCVANKREG